MIHNVIEFLLDNGASDNDHSGRSLLDHLIGVAEILMSWKCDKDIVLAGLCHSIYGTDSYHTVTVDPSMRVEVQALIGQRAELLAWEFCNRKNPRMQSFLNNGEIQLAIIECANIIEQKGNKEYLKHIHAVFDIIPESIRKGVTEYLRAQ
jgi:(p)ppGpp synthase/HD superfamily hydrolase